VHPLLEDTGNTWSADPVWSADGHGLAFSAHRGRGTPDEFDGLWLASEDGRSERPLLRGYQDALGWSPDGTSIYAMQLKDRFLSRTILRVPTAGDAPQPWLTLPGEQRLSKCTVSADAREVACVADRESDVWMIDDLDELAPR
jgi:Tol biopolymer transport system component